MTPKTRLQPALLFIESNTTGTGRLFVRAARAIGCRPILLTARPQKYAFLADADAPDLLVVPRVTEEAIAQAIQAELDRGGGIAGITSSSEYAMPMAATMAARAGLAGPDAACVRAARDKSYQREALAAAGLPVPAFQVVRSAADAVTAARRIGGPVVVKPVDGSGSIGVRACTNSDEVHDHAASLLSPTRAGEEPRALVESLIEGPELSVEVFSGQVIGLTRKHLGARPHFVETGHDYPAMPVSMARSLVEMIERATSVLGLTWGPVHWEVRLRRGQAYAIEVNPRLAGGFIPELIRHAEGIDVIRQTLHLVTGQPCELTPSHHRHASIRFLLAPAPGRFVAVEGLDEARHAGPVMDVALYRAVGDTLTIEGNFRDRIGHVITCADRLKDSAAAAARARDKIRVCVYPDGELAMMGPDGGTDVRGGVS